MESPQLFEDLTTATLTGWVDADAYLQGVAINHDTMPAMFIHHPTIENSRIDHTDFTPMQTERFEASDCMFKHCDFANVDLSEAAFYRVVFDQCRFVGTNLTQMYAANVQFVDCQMSLVWAPEATFKTVDCLRCRLDGGELSRAQTAKFTLTDCAIDGLGLLGFKLKNLDLSSCEFETLELDLERMRGLKVTDAQASLIAKRYLGLRVV